MTSVPLVSNPINGCMFMDAIAYMRVVEVKNRHMSCP